MTQALYRRYRPETFADVIGQEHVTEPLQQALRTGRVGHAYLFSGPRGCGKTTSARILARCLNCAEGPTATPCGVCDSCVALARRGAGTVDVIEIDAASHGGVDDARELRERASYGPAQSRYKIYIIDEAHMVTPQGFNALLKIVEEPPEHVKFVFATTEPEKVIGTIRSRTHHYPFRLVPPAQLQDYLSTVCASEGVPVEPGVLSFVVRAGGGSVRDSLSVLDQLIAGSGEQGLTYAGAAALLGFTDAELLDATITAIGHGDAAAAFGEVDKVIETGLDPRRFVEDLLQRLRDLIICAAVPDGAAGVLRGVPSDQLDRMHVQAAAFGPGGLSRAADIVNAGLTEMTGATAPRLQLELIIARLLLPGASGPQGYAARLDRVERRLEMGVGSGMAPPAREVAPAAQPSTAVSEDAASASSATAPAAGSALPPTAGVPPVTASPTDGLSASPAPDGRTDTPPKERSESSGDALSHSSGAAPEQTPSARVAEPASASVPESIPASPPAPEPTRAPTAGGLDHAAIVRAWPDILDWLSRHKRVTWTLVSASAQPTSFDGSRLVLAIETAGLAETFRRGAHPAWVQEALMEVLGLDARVECVVDADAPDAARHSAGIRGGPVTTPAALSARPPQTAQDASGPADHPAAQRAAGASGVGSTADGAAPDDPRGGRPESRGDRPEAVAAPPDFRVAGQGPATEGAGASPVAAIGARPGSPDPTGDGPPPVRGGRPAHTAQTPGAATARTGEPDWSSAPPPAASAPSWATGGEDPIERAPGPGGRDAATPAAVPPKAAEVVDDPDSISADDEDIETSGEIGQAVVERVLGGTVIRESDE
ncbi:DNA polymerase III subunit gamma and tau [Nostocoides sp. F2B08]|uniref:DNA polymerase III subunit gamma and tau n=1 Tax=Nostocoides sp. F2B08 TaxID=2653936 RepID=UPI001262EB28|nr:DNA polymerase III subunit gamma and tau [Tetrasphaera sp. F2B08]KAB7743836.1 DNA polymerase III subunit gamma and tau [Tetrasphaera sp. F2B08]